MAQEGLLGIRHQKAYDVVTDAGEVLHLGLGEAGHRDALEALLVGLFPGYVAGPELGGGVHEDELLVVHGDEVCFEALCSCVLGVWLRCCAGRLLLVSLDDAEARMDVVCRAVVRPMRCQECFMPSRHAHCGV